MLRNNGGKRSQFESCSYFSILNISAASNFIFIFGGWLFWGSEDFPSSVSDFIYITSMKQYRSVKNFTYGKVILYALTFRTPGK